MEQCIVTRLRLSTASDIQQKSVPSRKKKAKVNLLQTAVRCFANFGGG